MEKRDLVSGAEDSVTSNLISVPVRGDLVSVLGQASSKFVVSPPRV